MFRLCVGQTGKAIVHACCATVDLLSGCRTNESSACLQTLMSACTFTDIDFQRS